MKKKNNNILIVILILSLLITCSYIIYDKAFYEENKTTEKKTTQTENKTTKKKEENLDVNSRLVQTLYNKVVENNNWSKYWMYDSDTSDYLVSKSDMKTKMNLVSNNLNSQKIEVIECSDSIPNSIKINDRDYMSACYAISQGATGYSPYAYDKSYIETIYKDLFGNETQLDTSIDIPSSFGADEIYHYIASLDKYVLYASEGGGGTSASSYSGIITKAVKLGEELKITEKVTITNPTSIEEYIYVYTFKLEDDGMYSFVSRIKQD